MKTTMLRAHGGRLAISALLPLLFIPLLTTMTPGCAPRSRSDGLDPVGNYTLISVNDRSVPCEVRHGGHTLAVKSGVLVFDANAACLSQIDFVGPGGGETRREVRATYTRQGATLRMKWKGAGVTTGTLDGETFTLNNEGMKFVYRRAPQ